MCAFVFMYFHAMGFVVVGVAIAHMYGKVIEDEVFCRDLAVLEGNTAGPETPS